MEGEEYIGGTKDKPPPRDKIPRKVKPPLYKGPAYSIMVAKAYKKSNYANAANDNGIPSLQRQVSTPRKQKTSSTTRKATKGAQAHIAILDSPEISDAARETIWGSLQSLGVDDFETTPECYTHPVTIKEQPFDNSMFEPAQNAHQLAITHSLGARACAVCWNLTHLNQGNVAGNEIDVVRTIMGARMRPIDDALRIINEKFPSEKDPVSGHMIAGRISGGQDGGFLDMMPARFRSTCQQTPITGDANAKFAMVESSLRELIPFLSQKEGHSLQERTDGKVLVLDGREPVLCHIGLSFCTIRSTKSFNSIRSLLRPGLGGVVDTSPYSLFDTPGRFTPVFRFKFQVGIITPEGFIPKTLAELFGYFPLFQNLVTTTPLLRYIQALQPGELTPLNSGHMVLIEDGVIKTQEQIVAKGTVPVGSKFKQVR